MSRFEFKSRIFQGVLPLSWCVSDRYDIADSDDNRGRNRRPSVEDRRWSSTGRVLGGWAIGRSNNTVCGLHCAQGDDEHGFFWLSLKTKVDGFSRFGFKTCGFRFNLKTSGTGFSICASKSAAPVWWFRPKNHYDGFLCWVKNQVGLGLSVVLQNRRRRVSVGRASRSSGFLRLEASQTRVFQSDLKTGGDTTADIARDIIVKIASSRSWRQTGRYDGLYQTFLSQDRRFSCTRS
jgi:hypothetical protein